MNNINLSNQLAALNITSFADLKKMFSELYGFDCGSTNVHNLRKRLAYKIQEMNLGGLSQDEFMQLEQLAKNDSISRKEMLSTKVKRLAKGARFQRAWKGRTYEVIALDNGKFEYEGNIYRSLSAVAEKITGTHWNGRKFFGVK